MFQATRYLFRSCMLAARDLHGEQLPAGIMAQILTKSRCMQTTPDEEGQGLVGGDALRKRPTRFVSYAAASHRC